MMVRHQRLQISGREAGKRKRRKKQKQKSTYKKKENKTSKVVNFLAPFPREISWLLLLKLEAGCLAGWTKFSGGNYDTFV